jgi:hypothetical protein
MSKSIKYVARHNGEIVGTRTSAAGRVYTHAIAVWGHGKTAEVRTWCGRLDLAQGEQRKYQRYGYTAEIVPVEVVTKPSNAKLAQALNDSGVFAPFTCVGKD